MRKIVVGVIGSPDVESALDFALDEAIRRRLPLVAVHAYAIPAYGDLPAALFPGRLTELRERGLRDAHIALERARGRVAGGHAVDATVRVLEGAPAESLMSFEDSAALLVVGSRGGGAVSRAVRGSVAGACLRTSFAPVAVVPHAVAPVPDRWLRSRVVVGLDGSPASLAALSWGVAQAREWGSTLVPVVVSHPAGQPPTALRNSERENDLRATVWRLVVEAGGSDLEVHPRLLDGDPQEQLLAVSEPEDLLVLGSRWLGRMTSLLVGSTSRPAVRAAQCAVVVVREGQARREIHQRRSQPLLR